MLSMQILLERSVTRRSVMDHSPVNTVPINFCSAKTITHQEAIRGNVKIQ